MSLRTISTESIYLVVPSVDFQNFSKNRANQLAGHIVWFREEAGGDKKLGRVVGYYYTMAQLLLEVAFYPKYNVDPHMSHINLTAGFRPGTLWYTCVDVFLVDEEKKSPTGRYPHSCPSCGSNAFILFRTVECSNFSCKHHRP
jgi:hypothetical protein